MFCLCSYLPLHPVHICKPVIHFQIFYHLKRSQCLIRRFETPIYDLIPTFRINDPKVKAHSFHHYSLPPLYLTAHLPYLAAPFLSPSLHSPLNCLKYPSRLKGYDLFCRQTHFPNFKAVVSAMTTPFVNERFSFNHLNCFLQFLRQLLIGFVSDIKIHGFPQDFAVSIPLRFSVTVQNFPLIRYHIFIQILCNSGVGVAEHRKGTATLEPVYNPLSSNTVYGFLSKNNRRYVILRQNRRNQLIDHVLITVQRFMNQYIVR